jgi:hypothetical protein
MNTKIFHHLGSSIAVALFVSTPAFAQELPPIFPGVTTLGERTIPAPVSVIKMNGRVEAVS